MKTVTSAIHHIHDPRDIAVSSTKLRTTMLERAGSSRETRTQLLTGITSNHPIEVCAELGNTDVIKRSLRRGRAKNLAKNPEVSRRSGFRRLADQDQRSRSIIEIRQWCRLFVYAGCLPMSLHSRTSIISPWLEVLEPTVSVKDGTVPS